VFERLGRLLLLVVERLDVLSGIMASG